jgi:CheY-like chemotaxis protein
MQTGPQTLWTGKGLECRLVRTVDGFEVSVRAGDYSPFLRRLAHSHGDALNQGEYLRVLLDRTRDGVRKISSRQPLVLIVEDDPDNLFAYETMLRMDGLRTASASSLADARRLLREFQPDAVLLDHMLPDGEGGFMCGELRDSGNGEPLPILLVTGLDPRGLKLGSRDSPDAVLAKPCRPETLTSVLKLLVQRRRMAVKSTRRSKLPPGPVVSVRCPLCGTAGALCAGEGRFFCQSCARESALEPDHFVDAQL